ncbi:cell wall protein Ecm33 [Diatrype stigma]|uniref:Cell wall protein Ecm33 n=1 Tax=Diatrype stigma TaxID=117547 RepID=A0AAN9YU92_9PEZI
MYTTQQLVSALAALGMVSGVVGVGCDDPTATIKSVADATQVAECDKIEGSVLISPEAGQKIDLSGQLSEIGGDLTVENNGLLTDFSSTSLETIGGSFTLHNLTALSTLGFSKLTEVGSIDWATLTLLPELNFGTPGVTKAKSVIIADTFLQTIDGINVQSLTDMNLNNNKRLTKFSTSIKSLSNVLNVQANGLNLELEMPNLEWIANLTIANVTTFSAPSLKTVNGSLRFDSNYFESFAAPNLTEVQDGDISFVSNPQLTNLSFPALEKIGGGLTVANNTALEKVDGFQSLERVGGAVAFRGSFTSVELPKVDDVVGGFEVVSTEELTDTCDTLGKLEGGVVQGKYTCSGKEADANSNTGDADDSSSGSSGSGKKNDEGAAVALGININTLVSLAALGAVFTTFL